eukprot:154320-Chlamydomonas_euryale.AAC.2
MLDNWEELVATMADHQHGRLCHCKVWTGGGHKRRKSRCKQVEEKAIPASATTCKFEQRIPCPNLAFCTSKYPGRAKDSKHHGCGCQDEAM